MLTQKRFRPPNITGDANKDIVALGKAISDYLLSLEDKASLGITEATTVTMSDAGPKWGTYSTIYNPARFVINGFPQSAQFGGNAAALTEALVGGVEIPSTAAGGNHCTGVSGYARTASTSQGGVGVFGGASANADSVSIFSFNGVVSNAPKLTSPDTNSGYTNLTSYGIELDLNVAATAAGGTPTVTYHAVYCNGGWAKQPSSANGLYMAKTLGDAAGKWSHAVYTADGSTTTVMSCGTTGTGNTVASQPVHFRSRDSSARNITASLSADPDGNFIINMNSAGTAGAAPGVLALQTNAVDQFRVESKVIRNMDPLTGLGGGAAPTLGTIGGSGPATAAQNSWMKLLDSSGASYWVPAWK